jgi:hypothetical protein
MAPSKISGGCHAVRAAHLVRKLRCSHRREINCLSALGVRKNPLLEFIPRPISRDHFSRHEASAEEPADLIHKITSVQIGALSGPSSGFSGKHDRHYLYEALLALELDPIAGVRHDSPAKADRGRRTGARACHCVRPGARSGSDGGSQTVQGFGSALRIRARRTSS